MTIWLNENNYFVEYINNYFVENINNSLRVKMIILLNNKQLSLTRKNIHNLIG